MKNKKDIENMAKLIMDNSQKSMDKYSHGSYKNEEDLNDAWARKQKKEYDMYRFNDYWLDRL